MMCVFSGVLNKNFPLELPLKLISEYVIGMPPYSLAIAIPRNVMTTLLESFEVISCASRAQSYIDLGFVMFS